MSKKIIHCDADCFFAAVEMRDDPSLIGQPVAVGGRATRRGVIATCNYEARRYGVHSAMPSAHALRLCPDLIIIPGRMEKYREASEIMRSVFAQYTEIIEPLSLDEAYLDVSECTQLHGSATLIAREIQAKIKQQVGITVSAGVAPNKFLAKIASDWNKPNGLFVITPKTKDEFVKKLPVKKIHGVGKVTTEKLHKYGIYTCTDVCDFGLLELTKKFGSFGPRLYDLARGIDNREVSSERIRKTLSVEKTFNDDLTQSSHCIDKLPALLDELNRRLSKIDSVYSVAKAFVKVKFNDFTSTTLEEAGTHACLQDYKAMLLNAVTRNPRPIRLLGIGVRFNEVNTNTEFEQLELDLALAS